MLQLAHDSRAYIGYVKVPSLGGQLRMEHDLEEDIAQLVAQALPVLLVDGLQRLICLFEQIGPQGVV